jgi:hypothetical protein
MLAGRYCTANWRIAWRFPPVNLLQFLFFKKCKWRAATMCHRPTLFAQKQSANLHTIRRKFACVIQKKNSYYSWMQPVAAHENRWSRSTFLRQMSTLQYQLKRCYSAGKLGIYPSNWGLKRNPSVDPLLHIILSIEYAWYEFEKSVK